MAGNPSSARPTVVISNVYADDNRGGAAITQAAIDIAREAVPEARIFLIAVSGSREELVDSFRFTLRANADVEVLPPLFAAHSSRAADRAIAVLQLLTCLVFPRLFARRHKTIGRIAEADLVMGKGGQAFRNYAAREIPSLIFTTAPLIVAQRLRRPTALVAASIGPFVRSRTVRLVARMILRRLTVVMPRGPRSTAALLELGVDERRIQQVPDSVFRFDPPADQEVARMLDLYGLRRRCFLAMTVTANMGSHRRRAETFISLAMIAHAVLDAGLADQIAVIVQTDGKTSDRAVSEQFVRFLDDDRVVLVANEHTPHELMALYGGARATIGGRVHSAVFSVVAGTLAFPIEFGGVKSRDIFTGSTQRRILFPLAETAEALKERVVSALNSADDEAEVKHEAAALRAQAREIETALRRLLTQPGDLIDMGR
jgi:polysaccharide pyruvyl transferase WcaK-like protein